jgi:hypothetical protein
MTIVGSVAKATAALTALGNVDQVVTEAFLSDGPGLVLAQQVRAAGRLVYVLRKRRGRIVVYDRDDAVFPRDQTEVGAFLASALLENRRTEPASIESPNAEKRRRAGGRRRR